MVIFNDKIELPDDCAHWYIDIATDCDMNVFDMMENVLYNYYIDETTEVDV